MCNAISETKFCSFTVAQFWPNEFLPSRTFEEGIGHFL